MKPVRLDRSRLLGFKLIGTGNSGIGAAKIGVKTDVSEVDQVSMAGDKAGVKVG